MTALWIVGIVLFLLLVIFLSRVGAEMVFGEETGVTLRLGLVRLQVLPRKEKTKKPKKEKPPKKKKEEKPKKEMPKITARAVLDSLPELWRILKKGLRMTFHRVRVTPMDISAVIGGDDPADTALLYGRLSAAMYTAMPMLQELVEPMKEKGITFGWDEAVLALIAKEAYGNKSGARDLRRVIRRQVEDPICTLLVEQIDGQVALIKAIDKDGKIEIVSA